ncbi:hypothetical protein B9G69_008950 [Bdellovibrio sp. SKB1291214]|uniref:hypothetical protein n=1 Tax=Bdellovibrio sp. SKB1291214 TaxID=1732569 RepID=UPI000B51535A|nr:hypothetical protein [Bdellovibrio sp. SKB1291214]UYL10702.1 hypothetical protein B9G69_008950 [Bdellovibrio sp. SKB1291214]
MKISTQICMSLVGLLISSVASAGTTSGSIGVTLTIIDVAQSTAEGFSANAADYTGGRYVTALTTASDGETVGIYLNGQQVASAVSNKGVINFALNVKDASQVDVKLKSKGREVDVIQAAYRARPNAPAPQMSLDPQLRHMQVPVKNSDGSTSYKTVPVQSVIISY